MPYFGILDNKGRELTSKGYHRIDASNTKFKISPPQSAVDHMTMVNVDQVVFPAAQEEWKLVSDLALYDEPDSDMPLITAPIGTTHVYPDSMIVIAAGFLRIGVNYRRPGANDPVPPDEYQQLRHGLIQSQQDNVKIRMEAAVRISRLEEHCHKLAYALKIARDCMPPGTNEHLYVSETLKEVCGGLVNDVR